MFQRVVEIYLVNLPLFSSAISRYLVSNKVKEAWPTVTATVVSIRYIAVLGFQQGEGAWPTVTATVVSIRYNAVLGFQPSWPIAITASQMRGFHPLYRGT